jgi:hypothetical protein
VLLLEGATNKINELKKLLNPRAHLSASNQARLAICTSWHQALIKIFGKMIMAVAFGAWFQTALITR